MRSLLSLLLFVLVCRAYVPADKQLLADNLTGGYQVIACDVNGDGKPDLLAVASGLPDLLWFENPTWERHLMATALPHMINVACWTRKPHATPTIAVAYEFSMRPEQSKGIVSILTANGDPRRLWNIREIDRLPTSHRLRWADIKGGKNKVLVNAPLVGSDAQPPDYRGHTPLVYYRPADWKRRALGTAEEGIQHGIFITDWNRTGRDDILIGSFLGIHLYQFTKGGTWSRTEIAKGDPDLWPKSGTSDIAVGFLAGSRFLAAIEPWHGNQVVVYRQHSADWRREVIDDTLLDAHTVVTADLYGNGNDEIVVGFRGKPYGLYVYTHDGQTWKRIVLEQGEVAASGCTAADLDGNGKPAIACIGSATHNLVVYRNFRK